METEWYNSLTSKKEGIVLAFSPYLTDKRAAVKELVACLGKEFSYVSVLGVDVKVSEFRVDRNSSTIAPGMDTECGFVVKLSNGKGFLEYSLDDIGEVAPLVEKIRTAFANVPQDGWIDPVHLQDEPLVRSFCRENDFEKYTQAELLDFCKTQKDAVLAKSDCVLNVFVRLGLLEVSKLFISKNRELDQNYTWVNSAVAAIYQENEKMVQSYETVNENCIAPVLASLPSKIEPLLKKAHNLTLAKPITPGVYDVITDPSITGLIAHEAFGHGVEMDQFVKDRALAKEYVGKYVASPICNMRDGAASTLSAASYFFDDDGVLAGDTQIIKDGILVTGISDLASATQLGTVPSGNGRRESSRRKAYARMTNTFFEKGTDKLEDMIASIKQGYMRFETDNGMEDPKNWAIQFVAQYGIEIVDGKLTDNYVSPVVMSGYVPDLLKSISMVSDDFVITGSGMCGKGYKEWVRVSDGGPALKVKVKLG